MLVPKNDAITMGYFLMGVNKYRTIIGSVRRYCIQITFFDIPIQNQ